MQSAGSGESKSKLLHYGQDEPDLEAARKSELIKLSRGRSILIGLKDFSIAPQSLLTNGSESSE